ncbi:MOSC domain-containing protein [Thalassococcus sp. S3]|uniref:MOSC domain-containing protein n=1 Tax=Thalassococcus sp. S3 TaxID=2017482 RepID=UPI001024382D|nr:MOSC domain-containing protein [Thalassococcus sp. S3]QBF32969.1 sulfurase [Thalassococcus sp. S3]
MPTMKEVDYVGEIVWLGCVPAETGNLRAEPREALDLTFDGVAGERHEGALRPSCVRMKNLYPQGTEIRNVRQLSVLSQEEMDAIAEDIDLGALDPGLVGASLIVRGIPDFTHVPPASRLQAPSGATLTIDTENRPCVLPGREIEQESPGHGTGFKAAAKDRRGVTAWVEREGTISVGDKLRLFIPDQPAWAPEG